MPFPFFNRKKTSAPTKNSIFLLNTKEAERILEAKLTSPPSVVSYAEVLCSIPVTLGALYVLRWLTFELAYFIRNRFAKSNRFDEFLIDNLELELQIICLIIALVFLADRYYSSKNNHSVTSERISFSTDEFDKLNECFKVIGKTLLIEKSPLTLVMNSYLYELRQELEYRNLLSDSLSTVLPDVLIEYIREFNEEDQGIKPKV
jgi:hypothetical protein